MAGRRMGLAVVVAWLALGGASYAADAPEPIMAQGMALITEVNYFTNFNRSAYSLTVGTMEIRADKQGPLCAGLAGGQRVKARYSATAIILEHTPPCKLTVRRMEFTGAPQSADPESTPPPAPPATR